MMMNISQYDKDDDFMTNKNNYIGTKRPAKIYPKKKHVEIKKLYSSPLLIDKDPSKVTHMRVQLKLMVKPMGTITVTVTVKEEFPIRNIVVINGRDLDYGCWKNRNNAPIFRCIKNALFLTITTQEILKKGIIGLVGLLVVNLNSTKK